MGIHISDRVCEFVPWLEKQMLECELIYLSLPPDHTHSIHLSNPGACVCDVNCHFVETSMQGRYMNSFNFGTKLWKATFINDPELQKLSKFLKILNDW